MITLQDIKSALQEKGKFWIAFTGASTTSCEWVHPNWREIVEYVLKEEMTKVLDGNWQLSEWGIRGFNFAYDGATTKVMLDRLPDLLLVKPDLVIGMTGGNDPLFSISVEQSIQNISSILTALKQNGAKIVWSTAQRAGNGSHKIAQIKPYASAVVEAFSQMDNVQVVDMYTEFGKFPTERFFTFKSEAIPLENIKEGDTDLIHPNQLGNAYVAKVFLEEVFQISFDPEKYMETTLAGEKYPKY